MACGLCVFALHAEQSMLARMALSRSAYRLSHQDICHADKLISPPIN
jgi:hypothetical protein